jgi:hypothetical protein
MRLRLCNSELASAKLGNGFKSPSSFEVPNLRSIQERFTNGLRTWIECDKLTGRFKPCLQGSMLWSQFFCDFRQFSAKKWRFLAKINVTIKLLHNLALFWIRSANLFANLFAKIFKNYNIGPRFSRSYFGSAPYSRTPKCRTAKCQKLLTV